MNTKNKHEYFQHIASKRLDRILESLDALGGCSNPATYAYSTQELLPIFEAVDAKLIEIRQRLVTHSSPGGIPFRLRLPETIELAGLPIHVADLAKTEEVMELLQEGAPSFTSLEPIRAQYNAQFGNELCWTCPIFHDGHSGCVLLPVQEGVLYLPYNDMDHDTYEQFDLQGMGLLTKATLQGLLAALRRSTTELLHVLSDIEAFGLAQDKSVEEENNG